MGPSTVKSKLSNGDGALQLRTQPIDNSIFVYDIPPTARRNACNVLDQDNLWEEAACIMGYPPNTIIEIKEASQQQRQSPSDLLISYWGEQNHTVTELFMVFNMIKQYNAMECIRDFVSHPYHRLILKDQPNSRMPLHDSKPSTNTRSGPKICQILNESSTNANSICFKNEIDKLTGEMLHVAYSDLRSATDNWNEKLLLGKGGFAKVFKGKYKCTPVAIKRIQYFGRTDDLKEKATIEIKQILAELKCLFPCRHDNILPLYGFSNDGAEHCLVFQFMSGGSLDQRLKNTQNPLTLEQRKLILIGIARGLQYMHTFRGNPFIHGDIKPPNILLDENCAAKIGDFGLVRMGSWESMEVSRAYGTKPYLPNEFVLYRKLSTKVDTYSFGVVLLEAITGLGAYDKDRGSDRAYLTKYMRSIWQSVKPKDLIDKMLEVNEASIALFQMLFPIALGCISKDAQQRPEMVDVLFDLEKCNN